MLNLEKHITLDKDTINASNLCHHFTEADLKVIGDEVYRQYQKDKSSRVQWENMQQIAMNLAMQVAETKSFPWQDCSNIVFPLITIAALEFNATAYPTLMNNGSVVSFKVFGDDLQGQFRQRARKVSSYMNWQLLEDSDCWEEGIDKALMVVPIVGCAFKKTYFRQDIGKNVSDLVLPMDLVIDYYATSIEDASSITHVLSYTRNDIYERIQRGVFLDVSEDAWYKGNATPQTNTNDVEADKREGTSPPQIDSETPFTGLEQHRFLDLDGDGYAEPYIVTIEEHSRTVLRIVSRIASDADILKDQAGNIIKIIPEIYFTKIPFIPSPDNSIYDVGFGLLLGPLNESVNSAINQLFDAGTLANTAGGFLGRGAKIRGGAQEFDPFSWNRVDSTGDDLKKSVFPLPVREPSPIIFQLLSLIIEYTNQIAGATEATMGQNPGQNQPADVYRTRVEMGQKIYSAIFHRIWRAMKKEFRRIYTLNGMYLPDSISFGGQHAYLTRNDFLQDPTSISPAANPAIESKAVKMQKAMALRQAAASNPAYNVDEIEHRFLEALGIDDIPAVYSSISKVPPKIDPRIQIQQMRTQQAMANVNFQKMKFLMNLYEERRLTSAKITNLMAQADLFLHQAGGIESEQSIAAFTTGMEALKLHLDSINSSISGIEGDSNGNSDTQGNPGEAGPGVPGMEGPSNNQAILPSPTGEQAAPNGGMGGQQ